jgi:hypothetical protein
VLDQAFDVARAVVVLFTPDETVILNEHLAHQSDPEVRMQARPNVYFEAGLAYGRYPYRTILLELGSVATISDLSGRHVVRMGDDPASRQALMQRLIAAGCAARTEGTDWLHAGDFSSALVAMSSAPRPSAQSSPSSKRATHLALRVEQFKDDLGVGFELVSRVPWGIGEAYNSLREEAARIVPAAERFPRSTQQPGQPGVAEQSGLVMKAWLGQLAMLLTYPDETDEIRGPEWE